MSRLPFPCHRPPSPSLTINARQWKTLGLALSLGWRPAALAQDRVASWTDAQAVTPLQDAAVGAALDADYARRFGRFEPQPNAPVSPTAAGSGCEDGMNAAPIRLGLCIRALDERRFSRDLSACRRNRPLTIKAPELGPEFQTCLWARQGYGAVSPEGQTRARARSARWVAWSSRKAARNSGGTFFTVRSSQVRACRRGTSACGSPRAERTW